MKDRAVDLQKVRLATPTLELAPAAAAGIPIGPDIPQPHPPIIGTARQWAELRRGVHVARLSRFGREQQWRDKRGLRARIWGLLTSGTVGFVGETRKWLRIAGVLVERRSGLSGGRAGCGSASRPLFIQEAAQPQEDHQQEVIEKEVVCHGSSLSLRRNR
jgi:hypothetical protein